MPTEQHLHRLDLDRGAKAADKFWDAHRSSLSIGFFSGFIFKLMALFAAQESPVVAVALFNTLVERVKNLAIMKQTPGGH